MVSRYTKLRWRRRIKNRQQAIEEASSQAGNQLHKLVVRRWHNLKDVRRFVLGWLLLVGLLGWGVWLQTNALKSYYLTEVPRDGGIFREGVMGSITNMNPIYATGDADQSAARLIFSRLLRYDASGELAGDLATSWDVSENGRTYKVRLRRDVRWHDGTPFTARDVVFTYETIRHPDARSYLNASWQNIRVKATNDHTIVFTLPNAFTPFPHSLTRGGIIPAHVLDPIEPAQLRGHVFNVSDPIGTGPFRYRDLAQVGDGQQLSLVPNPDYYRGASGLDGFVLRTYDDAEEMIDAYDGGELASMAGLRSLHRPQLVEDRDTVWHDLPLNNAVYVFLRNDGSLNNVTLRRALTRATNRNRILNMLEGRFVSAKGPLLQNQLGYDEDLEQFSYNPKQARTLFRQAGWKKDKKGILRNSKGRQLRISMITQSSDDYSVVAEELQKQWATFGVDLRVKLVSDEEIQQSYIVPHNYQSLLLGVTIGADPDVFPYWHSSQAEPGGFNLSDYDNGIVDIALEAGRTRTEPKLRAEKYRTFLEQWRSDAPAIALYQPGFSYIQHVRVTGFEPHRISSPEERLNNVHLWRINSGLGEKSL